MSTLYISEYVDETHNSDGVVQIGAEPCVDQTPLTISGSTNASAAFAAKTRFVRIHTDTICSIAFGAAPTATTSNKRLAADQTEYFGVQPGQKVAVITNT